MKKMNLKIGVMKIIKMMKNIGLQKIKLIKLANVHNYLDSLPQSGKSSIFFIYY